MSSLEVRLVVIVTVVSSLVIRKVVLSSSEIASSSFVSSAANPSAAADVENDDAWRCTALPRDGCLPAARLVGQLPEILIVR